MKKHSFYFALCLVMLFLIVGCSQSETGALNSNGPDDSGQPNSAIGLNEPLTLENLHGMFSGFRDDFGGSECGGICWDIYTFLPDNQIFIGVPANGGPEMIDCTIDECQDYSINNGQLEVSGGDSFPIEIEGADLRLNSIRMSRVEPVPEGTLFDNHYKNISYSGLIGITGGASSKTRFLELNPDGTFELNGVSLGSVGGLSGGPTTNASFSDDGESGTYEVENNTITLQGNDGSTRNILFFIHDGDVNDIQLGEKNYYVDDE